MTEKINNQATFDLLNAIHHFAAGDFYISRVITETNPQRNAKKFLNDLQRKSKSIITDLKLVIKDDEARKTLDEEVKDPLAMDAICKTYLALNNDNRQNFEDIGSFILDSQFAAEKRKEKGYSAHFDERIGHCLPPLLEFKKETERHLKLIDKQIEILTTKND